MKILFRIVFGLYLLILLWLVLFKFSYDIGSVLANYQSRSINIVPFAGYAQGGLREMLDNLIVFIPFGLLLAVTAKQASFRQKLTWIFLFSLYVELTQFVLAIGSTDITDLLMNTAGGFIGLGAYRLVRKIAPEKILDWLIVLGVAVVLVGFMLLRVLVFKVQY